jgi:hypothetical protein
LAEEKRRLLDQAIGAIHEAEAALRRDGRAAPALYRRIIEVIDMQSNSDWNARYQELVDAKTARLPAEADKPVWDFMHKALAQRQE